MDYPGNTNREKEASKPPPAPAEKNVKKIVEGTVVQRKKPLGKRFAQTFITDEPGSVVDYLIRDVLVPAAKDTIADLVSQGIERLVYGDVRSTSRRTGRSGSAPNGGSFVSYNRFSQGSKPAEPKRDIGRQARASHNFDEIVLETRVEAEAVVDQLFELVSQYGQATVDDLYSMVGITGNFTDAKYGWTNLQGSNVSRTRGGGYLLDLPRPTQLD